MQGKDEVVLGTIPLTLVAPESGENPTCSFEANRKSETIRRPRNLTCGLGRSR